MPSHSIATCPLCESAEGLEVGSSPALEVGAGTESFFTRLFDADGFVPRWKCGTWSPELGWLHILSDATIFLAYAAIPTALLYFVLRRRDVPMRGLFWLFAAFILSCGITHLMDASMFYYPAYRMLGAMKLVTALVSTVTAVSLVRVMPSGLRLPSLLQAQESEITARKAAEAESRELSKKLQDRNSQLTVQNKRIERAMEVARIGVLRWEARTGKIDWEVGVREAMRGPDGRMPVFERWADVLNTSDLTALLGAAAESVRTGGSVVMEFPLNVAEGPSRIIRVSGALERGSDQTAPAIIGFARVLEEKGK